MTSHHPMRLLPVSAFLLALAGPAPAVEISVVGLFPNKAVLVLDGTPPKTYSVGASISGGMRLVAVDDSGATFESNGRRETIAIGGHVNRVAPGALASTTLKADGQGHFIVQGQINGGMVRMLVDTGATTIALPAAEAARLGIHYKRGQMAHVSTANGIVPAYQVKLDTVKVGDIVLNQVDATVIEQGLPVVLLGMSFLNRTEMRREGDHMTLTKRF